MAGEIILVRTRLGRSKPAPSACAETSECAMPETVGLGCFSQPVVVIVTFEKIPLYPSGENEATGAQVLTY